MFLKERVTPYLLTSATAVLLLLLKCSPCLIFKDTQGVLQSKALPPARHKYGHQSEAPITRPQRAIEMVTRTSKNKAIW